MNAEDIQELYKLLRGSRTATTVLDARSLFIERQYGQARALLGDARDAFADSRTRLMRQAPESKSGSDKGQAAAEARRLKRKQQKTRDILERFDELLKQLDRLARRERASTDEAATDEPGTPPAAVDSPAAVNSAESSQPAANPLAEPPAARPASVDRAFAEAFRSSHSDRGLELISGRYGFREVSTTGDIQPDALYLIHRGENNFLVGTHDPPISGDEVSIVNVADERPLKAFSVAAFLKLGRARQMVLLTQPESSPTADNPNEESPLNAANSEGQNSEGRTGGTTGHGLNPTESDGSEAPQILDMGAFSQLMTSAQRSGLVAGADQIGHVRDREFRKGDYDLAFQTIDAMYAKFTAGMTQRNQRLMREDADIASGRIRISPKDVQAKRIRDRAQTQEIERARRRFQVVLEGLRVLMNRAESEAEDAPPAER
jgi:hypothetical protein